MLNGTKEQNTNESSKESTAIMLSGTKQSRKESKIQEV
jgi:hypothetical protein